MEEYQVEANSGRIIWICEISCRTYHFCYSYRSWLGIWCKWFLIVFKKIFWMQFFSDRCIMAIEWAGFRLFHYQNSPRMNHFIKTSCILLFFFAWCFFEDKTSLNLSKLNRKISLIIKLDLHIYIKQIFLVISGGCLYNVPIFYS